MAKGAYIGVAGTAQEIAGGYIGIDGVARKIKKAYIGDENGKARECWNSLIVPWATGTDEQIVAMVEAADRGEINLADYWSVGDTRKVQLSAMAATGVGESHAAQEVEFTLMHIGGYTLNEPVASGRTTCSFVVGMKSCLNALGYLTTVTRPSGGWNALPRRTWCNAVFRESLPSTLKGIFKQFKVNVPTSYNSTSLTESINYFVLPAEQEVLGVGSLSNTAEANSLFQYDWYKTSANRTKTCNGTNTAWWLRSVSNSGNNLWLCITGTGISYTGMPKVAMGLSPVGCI